MHHISILTAAILRLAAARLSAASRVLQTRQSVNRGTPSRDLQSAAAVSISLCESRTGENPRMAYYICSERRVVGGVVAIGHAHAKKPIRISNTGAPLHRHGAEGECGAGDGAGDEGAHGTRR